LVAAREGDPPVAVILLYRSAQPVVHFEVASTKSAGKDLF
jgi:hypothetical protein